MSRRAPILPIVLVFALACAEPPRKEMDQAQGAIDAARAAGAEQYAAAEFAAAVGALTRAEEAVAQNDYRLALSLAMDSREQAQNAARIAGETRAKHRGDAERVVAEASVVLQQSLERLKDPLLNRASRRALNASRQALEAAEKTMQEARAALEAGDYDRAIELTNTVSARIQEASAAIDKAAAGQTGRPRR